MHYFQFNIGDYRRQTGHLTLLEHGVYKALLDSYYLNESPLTSDLKNLMRSHCIRTEEEKNALNNVLEDFFQLTDEGYTNKACEEVIAKYQEKSEKAAKSANARWSKNKDKNKKECAEHASALKSDANALQTHNENSEIVCDEHANHKPITNNQEPRDKDLLTKEPVNEPENLELLEPVVEADIVQQEKNRKAKEKTAQVLQIFNYWLEVMRKRKTTQLSPERIRAIEKRLKDGYTVETIKLAIDGCKKDAFSMGQNDRGKPYNDIELICRSAKKLDEFLEEPVEQVNKKRDINAIGKDFSTPMDGFNRGPKRY